MAILCLARSYADLKSRLGRIRVGSTSKGVAVTAKDVGGVGGMAVVLREAMLPNVVQTAEGTATIVHGGPFGNIAHGCSSIIGTRFALSRGEVVVTEGGFGFDLGAEKFLDIKCRAAGVWPHALVLVATLRALKFHGGVDAAKASEPNADALRRGFGNLKSHARAAAEFGLAPIVAINIFPGDGEEELVVLESMVRELGLRCARISGYVNGAEGGLALADIVKSALAEAPAHPSRSRSMR